MTHFWVSYVSRRCVRIFTLLSKPSSLCWILACAVQWLANKRRDEKHERCWPTPACSFGCSSSAEDQVEHYARCPVVWQFLSTPWPSGPGTGLELRGIDGFFGLCRGMSEERWLRTAKSVCAIGKVLLYWRQAKLTPDFDFAQALPMEWRNLA